MPDLALYLAAGLLIAWPIATHIRRRLRNAAHHIDTLLAPTHDTQPATEARREKP